MILLAEPEETLLAAKKKRQLEPSPSLTSSPKNRVWGFEDSTPGRLCSEPDLSWETAAGSVQYSYENVSGRAEFISRDPLSGAEFSQGTNLYGYVRNDFVDRLDPTGMINWGTLFTGLGQVALSAAGLIGLAGADTLAEVGTAGAATPLAVAGTLAAGTGLAGLGADGLANIGAGLLGQDPVTAPTTLPGIAADAAGNALGGPQVGNDLGSLADMGAGLPDLLNSISNFADSSSLSNGLDAANNMVGESAGMANLLDQDSSNPPFSLNGGNGSGGGGGS